jgi:hypothetical protein
VDLDIYQTVSGITVPSSQTTKVAAVIDRTRAMLETMLGYPLDPDEATQNLYNELGKTQSQDWSCLNVDTENLLPADTVHGAYRVFDYNPLDVVQILDPFDVSTGPYAVKLVRGRVTVRTFETSEYALTSRKGGLGGGLQLLQPTWVCSCGRNCLQLAIDADWDWMTDDDGEQNIPNDLLGVWADMVTFYGDDKRNIRSQTVLSHSWNKFDNRAPEAEDYNRAVIKAYAGPRGSVMRMPV